MSPGSDPFPAPVAGWLESEGEAAAGWDASAPIDAGAAELPPLEQPATTISAPTEAMTMEREGRMV